MTIDQLKELVRKAFEMAQQSGKPDWHRMTTAVLKNRLLVLTKGEFKEADYGAKNMVEFVHKATDILDIDKNCWPPVVQLKRADVKQETVSHVISRDRIRPDLWQAVMDYTSGNKYVWDATQGVARPQGRDDPPELLLPTISPEGDAKWREEFTSSVQGSLDEIAKPRLFAFASGKISPKILPPAVQGKWNEFIKAKIVETLADWFRKHNINPPERFEVSVRRAARVPTDDGVEELRELILTTVRVMTAAELTTVSLPPSAVLRARKGKL